MPAGLRCLMIQEHGLRPSYAGRTAVSYDANIEGTPTPRSLRGSLRSSLTFMGLSGLLIPEGWRACLLKPINMHTLQVSHK